MLADADLVVEGLDLERPAGVVPERETGHVDAQGHRASLTRREGHLREGPQVRGCTDHPGAEGGHVELHRLGASNAADVLDREGRLHHVVGTGLGGAHREVGVCESGARVALAEGVARPAALVREMTVAVEEAILDDVGAAVERGQIGLALGDREGQAAGR